MDQERCSQCNEIGPLLSCDDPPENLGVVGGGKPRYGVCSVAANPCGDYRTSELSRCVHASFDLYGDAWRRLSLQCVLDSSDLMHVLSLPFDSPSTDFVTIV